MNTLTQQIIANAANPLPMLAEIATTKKRVSFEESNISDTKIPSNTNEDQVQKVLTIPPTSTKSKSGMPKPNDKDVLLGRGAGVNIHPGNADFRVLVNSYKLNYLQTNPAEKKRIIKEIISKTEATGGRFVKLNPETQAWENISFDEAKRKTGQALRENAPVLKKREQAKWDREAQHLSSTPLHSMAVAPISPPLSPVPYPSSEIYNNEYIAMVAKMQILQEERDRLEEQQRILMHNFMKRMSHTMKRDNAAVSADVSNSHGNSNGRAHVNKKMRIM